MLAVDVPTRPSRVAVERPSDRSLRRFVTAAVIGIAVGAVPYLWSLWDMWSGSVDPMRTQGDGKIYDLQARAILHGHLYVKNGVIGLEAFRHNGHEFTYFGLFPSLLRIPVLLVTSRLDGRLTAASMFLAWVAVAVFSALLLWRIRRLLRGSAPVSRAEAAAFAMLLAVITGGSILVFLGASPWVYHEDLIWSVALSTGFVFALLGVFEAPTRRRLLLAAGLLLAANLNRLPTGAACLVAAGVAGLWFASGRAGAERRTTAAPLLGMAVLVVLVDFAVNFLKFGVPVGLPMAAQAWTSMNLHRRQFLAANHGKYYSLKFLPSTLQAYFQPAGLRFRTVFPFITLPAAPAKAVGVILDARYRTASLPASMPLLFILTCWGLVAALARRSAVALRAVRIPFLAMGLAPGVALVWGYIDPRFLADFLPVMIVGSALAVVDLWRRWESRSAGGRKAALAAMAILATFGIAANFGMAVTPALQWNQAQVIHYVQAQKSISDLTGHPITADVVRGSRLPYWAPADQLFVVGDCAGLYVSTGQEYSNIPKQQLQHWTWRAVGYGPGVRHSALITFHRSLLARSTPVPVLRFGIDTVSVQRASADRVRFALEDPQHATAGKPFSVAFGTPYRVTYTTDPMTDTVIVTMVKRSVLNGVLTGSGSATLLQPQTQLTDTGPAPVTVTGIDTPRPPMHLCHTLLRQVAVAHR